MLWTIIIILFALWLFGISFRFGVGLIHTLIIIALLIFIYQLLF
ncbi:MAG: lmo0937 family membrane protein [Candidatus Paceibacterota bacterium]